MKDLPEDIRSVDGVDVRTNGWPTVKITVNNEDHLYHGNRSPHDIYKFILDQLKGKGSEVGFEKNDDTVVKISTKNDILKTLSDIHEGGSDKIEKSEKTKKYKQTNSLLDYDDASNNSNKLISSSDFKALGEDTHFSDAFKVIKK